MKKTSIVCCLIIAGFILQESCTKTSISTFDNNNELLSGGGQTVFDESSKAYTHPFGGMSPTLNQLHEIGDIHFEQNFVSAPAPRNSGLGPLYNNVSCLSCHVNDGRGKVPGTGESAASILFRVSILGKNSHGGPLGVPGYGDQIQHRSIQNVLKEADVTISYAEQSGQFVDGTPYSLRMPTYNLINTYHGVPGLVSISPRVASPVFGLGLLEAVSDQDILALADESDANKDGISGRPNYVWNEVEKRTSLGKFGWKANQPSILQQVAGAYNGDMGITTFVFPTENSFGQIQFDNLEDDVELSDSLLYSVAFYIKTLSVPARRSVTDETVKHGKQLFLQAGCGSCHTPVLKTKVDVTLPAISNQTIRPYTDLLLHDMGAGLADNREDYLASGNEWRTPPLWGIGLTQKVNGHTLFLHDGRARNLMEAILWHGGEATNSKQNIVKMNASDRKALITFLESL